MDIAQSTRLNITMLDHIILTVSDLPRSIAFYSKALVPLGITQVLDYKGQNGHPDLMGFGRENNFLFWLKGGEPSPAAEIKSTRLNSSHRSLSRMPSSA